MNPYDLTLSPLRTENLDHDTEIALLSVPVEQWEPVVVSGNRVLDGSQRVLVARKHGFTYIPVTNLKAA
jgi:ParB-like chromosome segregation protein Spo0J